MKITKYVLYRTRGIFTNSFVTVLFNPVQRQCLNWWPFNANLKGSIGDHTRLQLRRSYVDFHSRKSAL